MAFLLMVVFKLYRIGRVGQLHPRQTEKCFLAPQMRATNTTCGVGMKEQAERQTRRDAMAIRRFRRFAQGA